MSMERRRFLGISVGAVAGVALGVPAGRAFSHMLSSADSPIYPPRGFETFTLSVCAACTGGCGMRVRKIGERVVKLEGNVLHPINAGRLCPRGQAALQAFYHPDRVPGPLRRIGPRGSVASFERATWDQALEALSGRLKSLREHHRPESLVLLRGRPEGLGTRVAQRFLQAFGSPNDVLLEQGEEAAALALLLTQGTRTLPFYDLQSSEYVLSLGASLLEAWGSPVHMTRAYGEFRQGRTGRRGKLVQVEPRMSLTAGASDEWIAVRPGTEGVFALGVAGVIVAEGLYDKDFVALHTTGFEAATGGGASLRECLERNYRLEQVSARTGVSVNVILRIAREFANARTRVAVGPRRGPLLPGRLFDHLAAQVLNALAGSVDMPGGVLVPEHVPLAPWPALASGPVAAAGRAKPRVDGTGPSGELPLLQSSPGRLAANILAGKPYPVEILLMAGADPVFASSEPDLMRSALERIPMVVSFASIPDDSALQADWILPESHFLERWDLHTTPPGVPFPVVSLSQPSVAKPHHDVRPLPEVFFELGRRLGPELERSLPWKDSPALIQMEMEGLYKARRGAIVGTPFDEAWVRMMEGAGWWAPGYHSTEELFAKSKESGGWWDPFYDHGDWKRVLATPSGRFDFRVDFLSKAGQADPSETTATGEAASRLSLHLFEPLAIAGGKGGELPFLQGILDPGLEERWETWAEIHPESAKALHIHDKDWIRIASKQGEILARARVTPRVVSGVVAIPVGLGKRGGGRWAAGIGSNPLQLLGPGRDPLCGLPDFDGTTVQLFASAPPGGGASGRG